MPTEGRDTNVTAHHDVERRDTPSVIESHEETHSRIGSTTHPYPSRMNDGCFARCYEVSTPPQSTDSFLTESYCRTLLRLGNGTPLWDPLGDVARPASHLKSGLMIGDVGVFNVMGDFSTYFNVFLPREDPIQRRCPPNFEPLYPPPQPSEIVTKPKHFSPGTILVSPGANVSCASMEPLDVTFTVTAREGSMLVLPDGASREDLVETALARIRDYVVKHIRDWYIFLNPEIHADILFANGSLCVVTGHDKATSWLTTAAGPYNPTGKPRTVRYSPDNWPEAVALSYRWSEIVSEYGADHCAVFVRTMSFALSTQHWSEHILRNEPNYEAFAFHYMPTIPVVGLRAFIQTMKDGIFKKDTKAASIECRENTFNPLVVILRYLLAESPKYSIATVEDSVWNTVASETDGSLAFTTRAFIRLLESHQISEENGYVTLIPSPTSLDTPPSTSRTFPSNVFNILTVHFQNQRRRRTIASKLSKVWPGPELPMLFRKSDPHLAS